MPERFQHAEEHTSHYSLFTCKPVGKTSGEVIAEIKHETLSAEHRLSYGTMWTPPATGRLTTSTVHRDCISFLRVLSRTTTKQNDPGHL
jgi:hypothetical protein